MIEALPVRRLMPPDPADAEVNREINDLAMRAQVGDKQAERLLLEAMKGTVKGIATNWKRHAPREDLEQEGWEALWEALQSWNPAAPGAVDFRSFVRIHIRGAISRRAANDTSLVKLNRAEQEAFRGRDAAAREARAHRLCGDVSVDAPTRGTDQPAPSMVTALPSASLDPEALLAEVEEQQVRRARLEEILEGSSDFERAAFTARFLTDPPTPTWRIARRLQCHKEQVRQAYLRVAARIKAKVGADWDPLDLMKEAPKVDPAEEATPKHVVGFCLFCHRPVLPERKVCGVHHWRTRKSCKRCGGRLRYRDTGGRQFELCDDCLPERLTRPVRQRPTEAPLSEPPLLTYHPLAVVPQETTMPTPDEKTEKTEITTATTPKRTRNRAHRAIKPAQPKPPKAAGLSQDDAEWLTWARAAFELSRKSKAQRGKPGPKPAAGSDQ